LNKVLWSLSLFLGDAKDEVYSFWRPRAPSGYAIFGDYLTPMSLITLNTVASYSYICLLMGQFC
jgi:hypothetical protein